MRSEITLYHREGTRSGRVRMLLEILELPYELVLVDTQNEEHKTEDYIAMHPFGLVPTMTHDGRVIVESGAQMIYLADLVPDKALAPVVGSLDRGTYYES